MKNIVIYSNTGTSILESELKDQEKYLIQVKDIQEIKSNERPKPDLMIIDAPADITKDILTRNKFASPLLIKSDQVFTDVTVRADAYDYILTPLKNAELKVRVANLLKIKQLKNEIKVVSTTDELTGLYNRPYLHQRLEAELSRAKRYNIPLTCILIDIDFFKVVNDIYGYDWGDVLLKEISEILQRHARKEDIVTRYGDEEFIVVLPSTDEENAYIFAERLRKDVEKLEFKPEGEEERHPVTVSGGIASYPFASSLDESAHTLIRYAEHALYNAKNRGRNKIIQFSQINLEI